MDKNNENKNNCSINCENKIHENQASYINIKEENEKLSTKENIMNIIEGTNGLENIIKEKDDINKIDNDKNDNENLKNNLVKKQTKTSDNSLNLIKLIDDTTLITKQLDLSQFEKNEELENKEKKYLFYDKHSKRLIQIYNSGLKTLNKSGTTLKKDIKVKIEADFVLQVAADKNNTYILLLEKSTDKKKKNSRKILGISLNSLSVIDILRGDFSTLISMFFITSYDFCLVFPHKLVYFHIDELTDGFNEICKYKLSKILIQSYSFNRQFKILIVFRTDWTFDLFNLNNKNFYRCPLKNFTFSFIPKKLDVELSSFNGGFFSNFLINNQKTKTAEEKIVYNLSDPLYLYSKSQYFLENLYSQLYFIYLSFENKQIHFIEISDLFNFPNITIQNDSLTVTFESKGIATLQFLDNLVLVHNFTKQEITIIDIKLSSNNKILCRCKINPIFQKYSNILINGAIIEEVKKKTLYCISFNNLAYYKVYPEVNKHRVLVNLTRRKSSKALVLEKMKDLLINKDNSYKCKNIYWLFDEIAEEIFKCKQFQIQLSKSQIELKNQLKALNNNNSEQYELIITPQLILSSKKSSVTQADIFVFVFKQILNDDNLSSNSDFYIKLIKFLLHFYFSLLEKNIEVIPNFNSILIAFIKKLSPLNKLKELFQIIYFIPISSSLAFFFLKNFSDDNFFKQMGFDMLMKLRLYYDYFSFLTQDKGLVYSIKFFEKYSHYFSKTDLEKSKQLMLDEMKKNTNLKKIMIDYLFHLEQKK